MEHQDCTNKLTHQIKTIYMENTLARHTISTTNSVFFETWNFLFAFCDHTTTSLTFPQTISSEICSGIFIWLLAPIITANSPALLALVDTISAVRRNVLAANMTFLKTNLALNSPALLALVEMSSFGCKKECPSSRCIFLKNNPVCTDLYKCISCKYDANNAEKDISYIEPDYCE